jgi:hypothetical protein
MKRDAQGKFALKDEEPRLIRSLRLTDSAWEKLAVAASASGMSRADWLEELFREQEQPSPCNTWMKESMAIPDEREKGWEEKAQPSLPVGLSLEDLEILCAQVLKGLNLGKQAPGYKAAQKVLKQLLQAARDEGGTSPP